MTGLENQTQTQTGMCPTPTFDAVPLCRAFVELQKAVFVLMKSFFCVCISRGLLRVCKKKHAKFIAQRGKNMKHLDKTKHFRSFKYEQQ